MWLVASFDLPAKNHVDLKHYRQLRKTLIATGFSFVQKSVAWRWCADREQCGWFIRRIQKVFPQKGDILFLQLPDATFETTIQLTDGEICPPPSPPDPWLIFS